MNKEKVGIIEVYRVYRDYAKQIFHDQREKEGYQLVVFNQLVKH